MKKSFEEVLRHRRSYYQISNETTISDSEIENIVKSAVKHLPSAFNSQSSRVVVLLRDEHKKLWDITKEELKKVSPDFEKTREKIDGCFASGYGTVLFFEDMSVVKGLQDAFPLYADNFPIWSQQTSGMHQFAIWAMLEDAGLGATL